MAALTPAERTPWELGFIESLPPAVLARYVALEQTLLAHGGERLLCVVEDDLEQILADGELMDPTTSELRPGRPSDCHRNAALLWRRVGGAIATGYALSGDGIWRQHSWVVSPEGVLIETTTPRVAYFGVRFEGREAKGFCVGQAA